MEKPGPRQRFTSDDCERMVLMRIDGARWPAIAAALGRTADACKQHYSRNKLKWREDEIRTLSAAAVAEQKMPFRIIRARMRQRALMARAATSIEHTSLTAAIMGDPLPGRSALDRRSQA